MQRHNRLKGGHRVGLNPNSSTTSGLSYQPVSSHNLQLSANQNWNYQETSWSQPNSCHVHSDNFANVTQDLSWDWDSSVSENLHSSPNQLSYQGVSSNNNVINASSHAPQDVASPQFVVDCITSPHVTQNRALSHVAQKSSSLHGTCPNTSSSNQAKHSTSSSTNNFASSSNSQNTISQNQASDEWGWNNDDNWDDWGNGEGNKPSVSTNSISFINNSVTTSLSQNSTVTSAVNVQEFPQALDQDQPTFQVPDFSENNYTQPGGRIEGITGKQFHNDNYQHPLREGYSQDQSSENEVQFQQQYGCHDNEIGIYKYCGDEAEAKPVMKLQNDNQNLCGDDIESKASALTLTHLQEHASSSTDLVNNHGLQLSCEDILTHTAHFDNGNFYQSTKDDGKWNDKDLNATNNVTDDLTCMIGQLSLEPPAQNENFEKNSKLLNSSNSNRIESLISESHIPNSSYHFDSQIYDESSSHSPGNYENNDNNEYDSTYQHDPQTSDYYSNKNQNQLGGHNIGLIQDSNLLVNPDFQNILFYEDTPGKPSTQLQSAASAPMGVTEWDDEWNDGWDKPNELDAVAPEKEFQGKNDNHTPDKASESCDELPKMIPTSEEDKAASLINILPEVKNIHVLNQELHGIFRSPSDNMLFKNSNATNDNDELNEKKKCYAHDYLNLTLCEGATSNDEAFEGEKAPREEAYEEEMDGRLMTHPDSESEHLEQFAEHLLTPNLSSEVNHDSQIPVTEYSQNATEVSDLLSDKEPCPDSNLSCEVISHTSFPLRTDQKENTSLINSSSRPNYISPFRSLVQPTIHSSMANEMMSANQITNNSSLISPSVAVPTAPEGASLLSEYFQPTETPPLMGPVGNISQLHARKGSPFQPPSSKRNFSPHSQSNPTTETLKTFTHHDFAASSNLVAENSLIANSHPPEQIVKLSVALGDGEPKFEDLPPRHELIPNSVPVLISSSMNFSASDKTETENITASDDRTDNSSHHSHSIQRLVPPPAHLSNLQPSFCQPKVQKLNATSNITSSPRVLDLTQSIVNQDETAIERDVPSFTRMVPGESKKGESNSTGSYHPPIIIPEMPSERVVTGNAYPQPIPSSRIKQEPSEIRSPPDGPDTANRRNDQNSTVVPPVRSETIGSEVLVMHQQPNDRRDDRSSDVRRDRNSWDKDPYERRSIRERNRDGRYRDESPYGRRCFDREYDSRMVDRYDSRRDTDEEEDDDSEIHLERKKECRIRGYRDEMDGYNDKDRRHRRRDYHEDEDQYFEGRSERSRPSSRSSSIGNLIDDNIQGDFHESSHRSHKDGGHREKSGYYRDRGSRNKDRSMREEPYYRDSRMKDPRDPYGTGYPYPEHYGRQHGMYDPQYFYYYQNYYKDYYRQLYHSRGYVYPPGGESMVDDKASTRSGRSSVNDEMKKSSVSSPLNSHFRQEFLSHSSTLGAYEPSAIYPEHEPYSHSRHPYSGGDVSGVPSVTDEGGSDLQQRLSPLLFSGPHLSASFSPGGKLLLVIPSDPKQGEKPRVQIRNVQKMLTIDKDLAIRIHKMKNYPGPLTVNDTHKDVVISFCNQKITEALNNKNVFDQDSIVLFWEYLSLLVKQNGKVCGADLASLLLKGREVNYGSNSDFIEHRKSLDDEVIISNSSPLESVDIIKTNHVAKQLESVKKFSELLCLGRKKEAVDYAIKEELWGYAMTLAAKMDTATHTRVMSAFTQSIPNTHVLQTLLQHLSGKRPDVSKTYTEDRWGDWQLHLAMMVSNPTGQPHRDRASIFAFGDTLVAKNRLYAAHLCYLAADAEWGTFSNKESKLVLLGSDHHLMFHIFTSDEAIQRTEIYEYARSLDSSNQVNINFQSYKLLYALRLAEAGFPSEALKYCEVIYEAIIKNLASYEIGFVSQLLDLATQLKYNDVHYQMGEGEARDMPDPVWLQHLQNALYTLQYNASQQRETAALSEEQFLKEAEHTYECSNIKQEPIKNTCNADTLSLSNINALVANNMSLGFSSSDCANASEAVYSENSHYYDGKIEQGTPTEVPIVPIQDNPFEENTACSMPYGESFGNIGENNQVPIMNKSAPPSMEYYGVDTQPERNQQQQQWLTNQEQSQQWQSNQKQSWEQDPSTQYPKNNGADITDSGSSYLFSPHSVIRDPEGERNCAMMSLQEGVSDTTATSAEPNEINSSDELSKKKEEPTKATNSEDKIDDKKSSGIFGSLFGWRKVNNNQAKLPDDKNPSIVWDDLKKKWVDVDGDEADESAPPPPPSNLPGLPPSIASFRGGPKKSRYVDPVGEKNRTKPVGSPLLPPVPNNYPLQVGPVRQMEPTNFMPEPSENQPRSNLLTRNEIQMRRNRYISESSSVDLSEEWDPGLSQAAGGDAMEGPIPMMAPPDAHQPVFFNPSQMKSASVSKQTKRAGPSRRVFNAPQ